MRGARFFPAYSNIPVFVSDFQVTHKDLNFWIVNHIPIGEGANSEKLYVDQCVCTNIENGPDFMYPVNPLWVENLVYVGRERLGVEFIEQVVELDHWAYGPHHAWTYPETGQLLRMWQPFNGLQVYPDGVGKIQRLILLVLSIGTSSDLLVQPKVKWTPTQSGPSLLPSVCWEVLR